METSSVPQLESAVHQDVTRLLMPDVVRNLVEIVGRKLTAYIGGMKDIRAVDRWMAGGAIYGGGEDRLRFALQLVRTLREQEPAAVVQAWLTGINPELGGRVPLRLLRDRDIDEIGPALSRAVRTFQSGM